MKRVGDNFAVIVIILILTIFALFLPLLHDFIFSNIDVKNYEIKEGLIKDVKLEKRGDVTCENIVIEDYDIFVECRANYEPQFKVGDKKKFYVYKGKGYSNENQMKSASPIGKILDYGLFVIYGLIFIFVIVVCRKKNSR